MVKLNPKPRVRRNGVLQGCPLSTLLLGGVMAVYIIFMKCKVPEIQLGIFVDDLTRSSIGYKAQE